MKIHAGHIEVAVAKLIGYRSHTIVPNVSWGLGLRHECDMLVLDGNGRFTEIEIKTTLSDLKADFKKKHDHSSKLISRLVYAMPQDVLNKGADIIPKHAGIIAIAPKMIGKHETLSAYWVKMVKHDKLTAKPSDGVVKKFMSLGCMRIWSLKEHNNGKVKQ